VDRSVTPPSPPAPRRSGMKLILRCIQILPLESVGLVVTCCLLYFAWFSDSVLIIMQLGHVAEWTGGVSNSTHFVRSDRLFYESTRHPG
jgi:hypothetical protein